MTMERTSQRSPKSTAAVVESAHRARHRNSPSLAQIGAPSLSDREQRALTALLISASISEAARRCGLSRRTLVRFKADPRFRAAYGAASRECFEDAKKELRSGTCEALAVLRGALRQGSRSQRIRAAETWLRLAMNSETRSSDFSSVPSPLPKHVILIGGTEAEYIAGCRHLRWSQGDFDESDDPAEIERWRESQCAVIPE